MRQMDIGESDEQQPTQAPQPEQRLAVLRKVGGDRSAADWHHKVERHEMRSLVKPRARAGNREQHQEDREDGAVHRLPHIEFGILTPM